MPKTPKKKHDGEPLAEENAKEGSAGGYDNGVSVALESAEVHATCKVDAQNSATDVLPSTKEADKEQDDDDEGCAEGVGDDANKKKKKNRRKKKIAAENSATQNAATVGLTAGADGSEKTTKYNFDQDFWDMKYATTPEAQEWLLGYSDIAKFFKATVKNQESKILIVGCGDAPFSADLYAAGYRNITNVDNSSVCIEKMSKRHPEMSWLVADAASMDCIDDESFGVVIEKSLIDTFYAAPDIDTDAAITNMWAEVWRVVEPGGLYFSLNFIMDTIEKGWTQRVLQNWSDQIGAAMGRPPWKSVVPVQASASQVPAHARKHPALFLCTKPVDLSIKQFS